MDQIKEIYFTNNFSFLTAQYSLGPRSLDQHSQETPRVLQVLLSTSHETHYDPNLIQGDRVQYEQSEAADLPRVFRDKVSNLNFLEFTILFSLVTKWVLWIFWNSKFVFSLVPHAEFTIMFSLVNRQASLGKNEMVTMLDLNPLLTVFPLLLSFNFCVSPPLITPQVRHSPLIIPQVEIWVNWSLEKL